MVGQISLIRVYYTNHVDFKTRPVLIFKEFKLGDFLFLPLTTNKMVPGIVITNRDLQYGSLKKESVIIVKKLAIGNQDNVLKIIGLVKPSFFKKVHAEVCNTLNCYEI